VSLVVGVAGPSRPGWDAQAVAPSRITRPSPLIGDLLSREALETVSELRASFALVRELGDEQAERLHVPGDAQRPRVNRIEPHVTDQT
jgi:hypothetical protein